MVMQSRLKYLTSLLFRCHLMLRFKLKAHGRKVHFIFKECPNSPSLRAAKASPQPRLLLIVRTINTTISCSPFVNSWVCVFSQASNNIRFALNTFKKACLKGCWHDGRITRSETEMLAASPPHSL